MIIAYDMDGVLRRMDLSMLMLAMKSSEENKEAAWEAWKMHVDRETDPILHPSLLALADDVIFCVTNCGNEESAKKKDRWLKHYYGERVTIAPVFAGKGLWGKEYVDDVARKKLNVIYDIGAEVYFDDDPAIIRVMREMHEQDIKDCQSEIPTFIKFMKYGNWIEELY